MSREEVRARYNIMLERYVKQIDMEATTLEELVETHVFPAIEQEISHTASMVVSLKAAGASAPTDRLDRLTACYRMLLTAQEDLKKCVTSSSQIHDEQARAKSLVTKVLPAMHKVREACDEIEGNVADEIWTLPKYRELLFLR